VKLLLDENLSPALVSSLSAFYPGTAHVRDIGLKSAPDPVVWQYAAQHGFTIATKDADFHHRSFLYGHPPKVIWVRLGNCSTNDIAVLFTRQYDRIQEFQDLIDSSFLVLA
jgi:predicted nuclease of predicted toxin-antitoxin system